MAGDFWDLISLLGGEVTDHGVERLVAALVERGIGAISQFDEDLGAAVGALETPDFELSACDLASDGTGIPLSDSAVEMLRLAVVAAGRERYSEILADPTTLRGDWDLEQADALAAVCGLALDAAEAAGLWPPASGGIPADPGSTPTVEVMVVAGVSTPPEHDEWLGLDPHLGDNVETAAREIVERALAGGDLAAARDSLGARSLQIQVHYLHPDEEWFFEGRKPGQTAWLRRGKHRWTVDVAVDASRLSPLGPYEPYVERDHARPAGPPSLPPAELRRREAAHIARIVIETLAH